MRGGDTNEYILAVKRSGERTVTNCNIFLTDTGLWIKNEKTVTKFHSYGGETKKKYSNLKKFAITNGIAGKALLKLLNDKVNQLK